MDKPLPPTLPEAAQVPSSSRQEHEKHSGKSQLQDSRHFKLDGLVRSMKDVARRVKSRYNRHARDFRLSMAWEVEEIV